MKIGYYICNTCNDFITSNFPYEKIKCLNCYKTIPLSFSKESTDKQYKEETKKFLELAEYFTDDEAVIFVTDKEFIKNELNGKSVTNWGQGEIGKTGFYQLAQLSLQHKGDKTTIFITDKKLVEEIIK